VKRTKWFPACIKPVRVGEYEVKRPCMSGRLWMESRMLWTGNRWEYLDRGYTDFGTVHESGGEWRGLTEKA
jgi:hypothetical protein